jgi:hypothetical protein
MQPKVWLPTCVALLVSALASPALAESSDATIAETATVDAARELFVEGVAFARAGDWSRARDAYARSLALKPSPDTLYSLAVAQQLTGQWIEASASYEAFLREPETEVTTPYRPAAQRALAELENRVGRIRLDIRGGKPPLEVTIDEDPWALHEHDEKRVNPGTHVLSVSAAGHQRVRRVLYVGEGRLNHLEVELTPLPSPEAEVPDRTGAWATQDIVGIGLLTAGGATLISGIAIGLVGVARASDAVSPDDAHTARSLGIAGDALAVAGGLAGGVGLILLLLDDGDDDRQDRVSVGPLGPDTLGVRLAF